MDDPFCAASSHTVWYAFTPSADMRVEINTFGSDYDTTLSVQTGTRGALTQIACNDNSGRGSQSRVRFDAVAGVTCWIMASSYYCSSGGHLVLNLLPAPPPLSIGLAIAESGRRRARSIRTPARRRRATAPRASGCAAA